MFESIRAESRATRLARELRAFFPALYTPVKLFSNFNEMLHHAVFSSKKMMSWLIALHTLQVFVVWMLEYTTVFVCVYVFVYVFV